MVNLNENNFACKFATLVLLVSLFLFGGVNKSSLAYAEIIDDVIVGDITVSIENTPVVDDVADVAQVPTGVQSTLANTGDLFPAFILIALLCGCIVAFCAISTRKLAFERGLHADVKNRRSFVLARNLFIVIISTILLFSTIFGCLRANADDGDDLDPEAGGRHVASVVANVVCDEEGVVKQAVIDITNKLDVELQIESIEDMLAFGDIINDEAIFEGTLGAGESVHRSWVPANKIDNEVLKTIKDNGGTYKSNIVSLVKYSAYHAQFMINDGTDDVFYDKTEPEKMCARLPKDEPVRANFKFVEWNTLADGSGDVVDRAYIENHPLVGNVKFYAIWSSVDAFMAPASGDAELPCKIYSGQDTTTKTVSIESVMKATEAIKAGQSVDEDIFSDTNDKWHLFVKIDGDGSNATDWLEMRIINVGNHDNDNSTLTFQTVHALTKKVKFDETYTDNTGQTPYSGNWETSSMRTYLNNDFYNKLPESIKSGICETTKKTNSNAGVKPNGGDVITTTDKVWILSLTEYINISGMGNEWWNDSVHDGSTYNFYASKHFTTGRAPDAGSEQSIIIGGLNKDRLGNVNPTTYGWQRSLSPKGKSDVLILFNSGNVGSYAGAFPYWAYYVAPSFAF